MSPIERSRAGRLTAAGLALLIAGCASSPYYGRRDWPERQVPDIEVTAYPAKGQDARQQRRDRYECHIWAVKRSGFDPSSPSMSRAAPARFEPDPPVGHDTAALGITGALIGAAVANPRHAAQGAAAGALIGALAGAASDNARAADSARYEVAQSYHDAPRERSAEDYRRALSACLEGRGYSVR